MYYPVVGERVWVSGCRDVYVVEGTDYAACVAVIALASGRGKIIETISFRLLFGLRDSEAALAGVAAVSEIEDVLRSSDLCLHQSRVFIRDLRETIRTALASIRKTQAMILESDQNIARWQELGCAREEEKI